MNKADYRMIIVVQKDDPGLQDHDADDYIQREDCTLLCWHGVPASAAASPAANRACWMRTPYAVRTRLTTTSPLLAADADQHVTVRRNSDGSFSFEGLAETMAFLDAEHTFFTKYPEALCWK